MGVYVVILPTVVSFSRSEPLRSWGFRLQSSPTVVAFNPSERLLKSDCGGRGRNPRNCHRFSTLGTSRNLLELELLAVSRIVGVGVTMLVTVVVLRPSDALGF